MPAKRTTTEASNRRDPTCPDRRDPAQPPHVSGRRASDPTLTTRHCADRLGVSSGFIVGEIRDGRLIAMVIERHGMRTIYRVSEEELDAYLKRHQWGMSRPVG